MSFLTEFVHLSVPSRDIDSNKDSDKLFHESGCQAEGGEKGSEASGHGIQLINLWLGLGRSGASLLASLCLPVPRWLDRVGRAVCTLEFRRMRRVRQPARELERRSDLAKLICKSLALALPRTEKGPNTRPESGGICFLGRISVISSYIHLSLRYLAVNSVKWPAVWKKTGYTDHIQYFSKLKLFYTFDCYCLLGFCRKKRLVSTSPVVLRPIEFAHRGQQQRCWSGTWR